jgi:hypothetical protein
MAYNPQFDSLEKIVAVGGELAAARLIERGLRGAALNSALQRRFPGIDPAVRGELIALGRQMVAAARDLNGKPSEYEIDPSAVPTVPMTFRGWGEATRAKVGVEVVFPNKDKTLRLLVSLPDISDLGSIYSEVYSLLETLIDQYEERIEGLGTRKVPKNLELKFGFMEKGF